MAVRRAHGQPPATAMLAAVLAVVTAGAAARAVTIQMDYRYDVNGFFDSATPAGATARASLEAAAAFFSGIINDSLNAITAPGGSNIWRQVIMHPGTGQTNYAISSAASAAQELATGWSPANEYRDISVPANRMIIYAGATNLNSLALGGTAYASFGTPEFNSNIAQRGKSASEYAAWGGYVSFDNAGVSWHVDHTQPVPPGKNDLYSTALHEIGHVVGLATHNGPWNQYQVGAVFTGPEATAAWKADDPAAPASASGVPTVSSADRHWKDNAGGTASVRSKIIGTNQLQEASMDPTLLVGSRKLFTNVDGKALRDIGWTIPSSVFDVAPTASADFNGDGQVNGADLAVWKAAFGPVGTASADGDGDSDGNDFLLWQRQFGTAPQMAASMAAPEPGGGAAAVWCLLATALRRRRLSRRAAFI